MKARVFVLSMVLGCSVDASVGEASKPPPVVFVPSSKHNPDCDRGDERRERNGTDCACCHGDQFAVSGSLADEAMTKVRWIEVVDGAGTVFTMTPNPYGNFFRHRPPAVLPLRARLLMNDGSTREMRAPVTSTSCNSCHGSAGSVAPIGHDVGALGSARDRRIIAAE